MSVSITSSNYSGQIATVTLYSSTGNTLPYTSATTISLGSQTIPFTYSSTAISNEYGVFSCFLPSFNKTCIVNQQTPPDGDGNVYQIIKIGTQVWMRENLKTTKFRDGTPLDNVAQVGNSTWAAANGPTTRYWALVNGTTANTQTYGLIYNQFSVTASTIGSTDSVNLCPTGWHIPTDAEFSTLNTFLGANAGTQMKSTTLWQSSGNGTNSSGFDGRPAGTRTQSGASGEFSQTNYFWVTNSSVYWYLYFTLSTFSRGLGADTRFGFPVRCIKD